MNVCDLCDLMPCMCVTCMTSVLAIVCPAQYLSMFSNSLYATLPQAWSALSNLRVGVNSGVNVGVSR